MQITDFVNDQDLLLGRLVEQADGKATFVDMEDGGEYDVKHITRAFGQTLIITWIGYAYTL